MTPDRWREVERLYHAALEHSAGDRANFLAVACGADDELRREVESLLAHSGTESGPLDGNAMAAAAELVSQETSAALIGRRVRTYELQELIGAGGMGEVYRARDTRLGRDVAIKILPPAFKEDPDRIARFEREAHVLASLSHPHIGAIYGVEDADDFSALVMEFVEGEDLSQRLARGPIPMAEALTIARQVADALEAAHERGVIHRDLKPANIKVRRDGLVKLLDFGLAKALAPADRAPGLTSVSRRPGAVLGTPAYMSPEQARGEEVGRDADIWAFGAVLYELLTGTSPFARPTTAETLARVLGTPPDPSLLPRETPASARRLVRRCLEPDRKRRLHHMGDARIELDEALSSAPGETSDPITRGTGDRRWQFVGALVLMTLAGAGGWLAATRRNAPPRGALVRLAIPAVEAPAALPFGERHVAIAADGSTTAYASGDRLWLRRLDASDGVAVDVRASGPFFSPDGEWVGFFDRGIGLYKVPVRGGTPTIIAPTADRPLGATWGTNNTIVFATSAGLYQVSENGGEPQLLARPDPQKGERGYAWPQFIPGQQSVLITKLSAQANAAPEIALFDVTTRESRIVLKDGTGARYTPTGHLVYASGQTLNAIRFNADARATEGDPVSLPAIDVATAPDNGAADFAVSETGTLLFIPPNPANQQLRTLRWIDRGGREEPLALAPGPYAYARISPDGGRLALDIPGANRDIWIFNLHRRNLTKLTAGPTEDLMPVWSRDGRRIFFASDRTGNFDLYSQAADGATPDRLEYAGPGAQMPISVTPDGSRLLVVENFTSLSTLDLERHVLEPLLQNRGTYLLAEVSPDGKWIAYESNESGGQLEIFLRPLADLSGRREKVSIDGGRFPMWGPTGGELFFVDLNGVMTTAPIAFSPGLRLGRVAGLFDAAKPPRGVSGRPYDISPVDGRFLILRHESPRGVLNISVVLNWFEELRERAPRR